MESVWSQENSLKSIGLALSTNLSWGFISGRVWSGGNAFHIMDTGDPALLHDLGTLVASLGPESPTLVTIFASTGRRPVSITVFLS